MLHYYRDVIPAVILAFRVQIPKEACRLLSRELTCLPLYRPFLRHEIILIITIILLLFKLLLNILLIIIIIISFPLFFFLFSPNLIIGKGLY